MESIPGTVDVVIAPQDGGTLVTIQFSVQEHADPSNIVRHVMHMVERMGLTLPEPPVDVRDEIPEQIDVDFPMDEHAHEPTIEAWEGEAES